MEYDCSFEDNIDNHVVFTYISQWEKHSIEIIKSVAEQTRNDLRQIYMKNCHILAYLVNQINEQINTNTLQLGDLHRQERQLRRLQQDLNDLRSNTHLIHDKNTRPIYMIKLSQKCKQLNDKGEEQFITASKTNLLKLHMLNEKPLNIQKQILGEQLFGFVQQIEPKLAAKITGMFLEFDIEHILILIQSSDHLLIKVKEAIQVLQVHEYRQKYVHKA